MAGDSLAGQPCFSPSSRRPPPLKAKHGLSAFGDLAYPADFEHFAYANPDAPKGGTFSLVGWGGVTTFNSLNNYILKGDAAQGLELLFDSLMVAGGRRARRGLWAGGGERRGRRRRQVGDLPFAARGAVRRRHAAHRRRRGVLLRHAEDQRPPDLPSDAARRGQGRGARPAHGALQLHGRPRARPAAHRRRAADLLQGLLCDAALRGDDARPAARLRPLSGRPSSRKGAPSSIGAIPTIGRRICRSIAGAGTSTRSASNISATAPPAMEAFKAGAYDFREEFTSKVWATEYDFPAIRAGKVKKEVLARRDAVGHARLLPQHAARATERPARARGARPRLRFRVDQPQHVLRALRRARRASSRTRR